MTAWWSRRLDSTTWAGSTAWATRTVMPSTLWSDSVAAMWGTWKSKSRSMTRKRTRRPIVWKQQATLMPEEDLLEYFCEENEKDVQHFQP